MPASSKEFLDIQAIIECEFTLKRIPDMTRTYSQEHLTLPKLLLCFDDKWYMFDDGIKALYYEHKDTN